MLAEVDELVVRVRRRMPDDADIKQKVGVLNRYFFRELGFTSNLNDYYDPDNSHLNVVLKRRRGIPISLAVVYLEMAEQLGIPVRGVSFPGHFLLRVTTPDGDVMLDPTTGHSLSESQMVEMLEPYVQRVGESLGSALRMLLQPATRREIVARMLRNLKSVYLQTERWQRLLAVQQRLVILLPESIEEVRDRGFAYARLDYLRPATGRSPALSRRPARSRRCDRRGNRVARTQAAHAAQRRLILRSSFKAKRRPLHKQAAVFHLLRRRTRVTSAASVSRRRDE